MELIFLDQTLPWSDRPFHFAKTFFAPYLFQALPAMTISVPSDLQETILRIGSATLMGVIVGIERDWHYKPAGVRVLAMVSMASAAVTMPAVGLLGQPGTKDVLLHTVQGVLSGIGFLGAGVILHGQGKNEVQGLTTAASIWTLAVLGILCGMGEWKVSLVAFGFMLLILTVGRYIERLLTAKHSALEAVLRLNIGQEKNPPR